MKLTIYDVDYAPKELSAQVPIEVDLLRMIPGSDRPDYWLEKTKLPLKWLDNDIEKSIPHIIVCARWVGTEIGTNFKKLPVGIAYITDQTLLEDEVLSFEKCKYIAIGTASVT